MIGDKDLRSKYGFKEPWIGVGEGALVKSRGNTELIWAAGFFDGEGCIMVRTDTGSHKERIKQTTYTSVSPALSVAQVDPRPLYRFARAVNGREPGGPYKHKNVTHSEYYRWDSSGGREVHRILMLLWPYLSEPKKEQALGVWKAVQEKRVGPKNQPLKPLPDYYIGVDLDTTLAHVVNWNGYGYIGEPIPAMLKRTKKWLKEGKIVKIFTARVEAGPKAIQVVQDWCEKNGLGRLEVTNVKDSGMVEVWDDLAIKVLENKGQPCCKYKKNWKTKIIYG